jgi:hypothetical protein
LFDQSSLNDHFSSEGGGWRYIFCLFPLSVFLWPLPFPKENEGGIFVFFFHFSFFLSFPVLFPRCASLLWSPLQQTPLHYLVVGSKSPSPLKKLMT